MATTSELKAEIRKFAVELLAKHGLDIDNPDVALFTMIEDAACELGDTLAQEVIRHQAVQRTMLPSDICPRCGQLGINPTDVSRTVETCRGPVEIPEVEFSCKQCRKSFFPSVSAPGVGGGLRLQPALVGKAGSRRGERQQL